MDFALFPRLKSELRGQRFEDSDELLLSVRAVIGGYEKGWFRNTFNKWVHVTVNVLTVTATILNKKK